VVVVITGEGKGGCGIHDATKLPGVLELDAGELTMTRNQGHGRS